jgi:hypothetical protein
MRSRPPACLQSLVENFGKAAAEHSAGRVPFLCFGTKSAQGSFQSDAADPKLFAACVKRRLERD